MKPARPPALARRLLRLFLPNDLRVWTLADIDHRYGVLRDRDGPVMARRWYRRQVWHALRVALGRRTDPPIATRRPLTRHQGPEIMNTLLRDMRQAVRVLAQNRGFTIVAVLTLGLGVGANTALFSIINGVLLRPLPFEQSQELVVIYEVSQQSGTGSTAEGTFLDWREQTETLTDIAAWGNVSFILQTDDDAVALDGVITYPNFLRVLGVRPRLGRPYMLDDAVEGRRGNVIVISHRLWQERWGSDPETIGRVVRIDGAPVEIIGVMPPRVAAPEPNIDVWLPEKFAPPSIRWMRHNRWLQAVARLRPEITLEQAQADMARISAGLANGEYSDIYAGWSATIVPLREQIVGDARPALVLAFGAVSLILLMACANVANMLMARATVRRQELAVRAALGAGRSRLVQQLLTESVVLGVCGGVVGTAIAFATHRLLLGLQPDIIPRAGELVLDATALGFALVISVLTGLLFGVAPAFQGGRIDLRHALTEGGQRASTTGTRRRRQRSLLVAFQMAVTVILLSSAAVLIQTMVELNRVDPGFRAEGAVALRQFLDRTRFRSDSVMAQYAVELEALLASLPGVSAVGATSALPMDPLGINYDLPYRVPGNEDLADDALPQADYRIVTPGYFRSMGIQTVRGRGFTAADDATSPFVILVNQTMADEVWPDQNPIGQRIYTPSRDWAWFEVVGVVADTRYYGLNTAPRPEMYVVYAQQPTQEVSFVVHTAGDPALIAEPVRQAALALDPSQPAHSIVPVSQLIADTLAAERFYGTMLTVFAGMALSLSAVGIYGVLSYWVSQRRQEIGVRLALGATRRSVMRTVVQQGLGAAAVGSMAGLAGAVVVTRAMQSAIATTTNLGLLSVGTVLLTLGLVATAACAVPAFRASRLSPMQALRG